MRYKTGKKEKIVEYMKRNGERSLTLSEICSAVCEDEGGKSTVYRLVSELTESGILRRLSDGYTRHCTYQYVGEGECRGHLHLKCVGCGRLFHLDSELSGELRGRIRASEGFTLDLSELLFGRCRECEAR